MQHPPKRAVGGREQEKRDRSNSATVKRQDRANTQPHRERTSSNGNERGGERNELKHVFARLQSKSVAQKLKEHLQEEEAEQARPAKEDRGEERDELDGSTSNLKSKYVFLYT